ncbi:MAG: vitamin K epoxide reductase family protein [Candidatus Levybacteria bacterium]|nr:vitamin K epoxide reductase family protein [Candidatus Levybacteria bacterium]
MNSKKNKLSLISIAILSFLGFVDSTYLTIVHYRNIIPPCSITHGCEEVLNSKFATIGNIPISIFGSAFFILILVLCILILQKNQKRLRQALFILVNLGIIAAIILFYLQWIVLKAFCQYCLLVEAIILGMFILSFRYREKPED